MKSPLPHTDMISKIANEWMLVSAGTKDSWNTMTASWGGVGSLWNKPVAFVFVRPQRYTFRFTEEHDTFSLSFFDESYRPMLKNAGTLSGRDINKMTDLGLTAEEKNGTVAFREANLTLICKKLYAARLDEAAFLDPSVINSCYPAKDFHQLYIAEIVDVLS